MKDDAEGGGGQANAGNNGDKYWGDDGIGTGKRSKKRHHERRGRHGDEDGHLFVLELEAAHNGIHKVVGYLGA